MVTCCGNKIMRYLIGAATVADREDEAHSICFYFYHQHFFNLLRCEQNGGAVIIFR